ncbi:MAG TPA: DoxX family protein [Acidimicrobiia bacterium]|nr:DoxX family protein [Acidimicrobiia bacterium]
MTRAHVDRLRDLMFTERTRGWLPLVLRVVSGVVFVSVSMGKFFDHASEAHDFDRYGVPIPATAVIVVGIVELVGGVSLVAGLGTRVASALLAGNMVGAIATAGRVEGGAFNLVLAPLLLVSMLVLLWAGPGAWSVDRVVARRLLERRPSSA